MANSQPNFFDRAKKRWWIAALIGLGGALIWYSNVKSASKEIAADLDAHYHHRAAGDALIQLARVPHQSDDGTILYMASFENRSDEPMILTGVIYDVQEIMNATASTDVNVTTSTAAEAGPMSSAKAYDRQQPCKNGTTEALVPPFRLRPQATGSFEIRLHPDLNAQKFGCALVVRFLTNQGKTNGLIPDRN